MEELARVSASELVVQSIHSRLQRGELKVGDRLPVEAELAKELNVGRSSLREGMKILAAYGVVESRQGEGTFIVDRVAEKFFELMGFFPSKNNYEIFLELRRIVEVGNLLDIYDKISPEEIKTLEGYIKTLTEKHRIEEYVEADYGFHDTLISISHNPMLNQINKMLSRMRRDLLLELFTQESVLQESIDEHSKILEGLKAKNPQMCMEAMYEHIATTMVEVSGMI